MVNAYIPNSSDGTASVIDTVTDTVKTGTGYPITVGTQPIGAAVTQDGKTVYVTNETPNSANGTVSVIDVASNTVTATINVGKDPFGVAFTPDGTKAYVANENGSMTGTVSVIDTSSNTIIATITVGLAPAGVAITPDSKKAYVTNAGVGSANGTVSVIDIATNTVTTTITVGKLAEGVAFTPDGSKAYVANSISGTISVIATATDTVSTTLTVGTDPERVAFTPDGSKAYVSCTGSNNVYVINATTDTVITGTGYPITVGNQPVGVAITPDGSKAYVPNYISGTVSVIATATDTVSTTLTVGTHPWVMGIFIQPAGIIMTSLYTAPQGRLTLTSNTPVMTADATAQTSIYYTPYQGNLVPIYDGANMNSYTFSQLTMTLNTSNQTSGNLYDLFVFLNGGVVTIGAGPAWSSGTSRGTGAGTTELQQTDGLWTNKNSITLKNGSTSYSSIAASQATYLGTMYATANGQTGMQFRPAAATGGNNTMLALYNAYNRVLVKANSAEATSNWTYATATWRAVNASNSNRINWVDGLQQSFLDAYYQVATSLSSSSINAYIGMCLNGTSTPNMGGHNPYSNTSTELPLCSRETATPQLGFNFIQAVEYSTGATATFYGNNNEMWLEVSLMM